MRRHQRLLDWHRMEITADRLVKARWGAASLFFLNGLVFASWVSRIPLVQQRLGLDHAVLGAALLCVAAGAVVAMPLAGILSGRVGSGMLCRIWVPLFIMALPLLALCPNVYWLGLGLFFFGCGHGTLDVAMNGQAVAVESRHGKPIMSSFHAMFSLGGLVGAAFGAWMAGMKLEPLWHFTLVAGSMGIMGWLGCRQLLMGVDRGEAGEDGGFTLPPKALVPLGIIAIAVLMGEGAMADWTGVFLHKVLGATEAVAAIGYAAFSASMTAGRLSGDWLVRRLGDRKLVACSGIIAAVGMAVAVFTGSPWVSLAGFVLVGAGYATVVPCVFSAAGRMPGVPTGVALASVTTMGYLGFLMGPPLIGFVAEGIGLQGALVLLIGASLLVTALSGKLR